MHTPDGRKVTEVEKDGLPNCISIWGKSTLPNDQMGILASQLMEAVKMNQICVHFQQDDHWERMTYGNACRLGEKSTWGRGTVVRGLMVLLLVWLIITQTLWQQSDRDCSRNTAQHPGLAIGDGNVFIWEVTYKIWGERFTCPPLSRGHDHVGPLWSYCAWPSPKLRCASLWWFHDVKESSNHKRKKKEMPSSSYHEFLPRWLFSIIKPSLGSSPSLRLGWALFYHYA